MYSLKGIIFSLSDVLAHEGAQDTELRGEVVKLLKFLLKNGIQPILISNRGWTVTMAESEEKIPFQDYVSGLVGEELPYYQGGKNISFKQKPAAMEQILDEQGWSAPEVLYVGNSKEDMIAASNGGFPFLNAQWHEHNSPYGFTFSSPKEIASFVDCCCITPNEWFWSVEDEALRVYAIAPLAEHSSSYPQGSIYSTDAKSSTKRDVGNIRFWGLLMAARIHLSGIGSEINFVAPYPGHSTGSKKTKLMGAIAVVSGSLRAQFVYDLIERHTDAVKSQTLRTKGGTPDIANQLNTIHLNPKATKPGPKQVKYKNPPNIKGKTVLIVDDICTQGYSLEAARAFCEAAGAKVILLSWLKTPGPNNYHAISSVYPKISKAFQAYAFSSATHKVYSNSGNVTNKNAPKEIADAYSKYASWEWPTAF
jgi:hypoxanthine phosphoribosyltransferase